MADLTYKELSDAITVHALKDPAFRKELLADPVATFEKYSGQSIDSKIFVHENSPTETHFVLPPAISMDELSDADLEKVAGGEVAITVALIGGGATVWGAAVGSGIAVANDQTRSRGGW